MEDKILVQERISVTLELLYNYQTQLSVALTLTQLLKMVSGKQAVVSLHIVGNL